MNWLLTIIKFIVKKSIQGTSLVINHYKPKNDTKSVQLNVGTFVRHVKCRYSVFKILFNYSNTIRLG